MQEFINGLAKPQMRCVTKREILTKGKFQQKWRGGGAKIHQRSGQIFKCDDKKGHVDSWRLGPSQILRRWRIWREVIYKEMTKRGILTNGDYNKNGKFGNNSFKVCQNQNKITNEAC